MEYSLSDVASGRETADKRTEKKSSGGQKRF